MGLITLFFLAIFSTLYIGRSMENKSAFLVRAIDRILDNLDKLSYWGIIYGAIAVVVTPIVVPSGTTELMIRFLANGMVVLMALPFTIDRVVEKYGEKINNAIISEGRLLVKWLVDREKYIGWAGAAIAVLLFAFIFR